MCAILFDLGNVLVRYAHDATVAAVAALYGVAPATLSQALTAQETDFGLGLLAVPDFLTSLIRSLGREIDAGRFARAFCAGLARDDAALAYALSLQKRAPVQIGAISNTNEIHVVWLDQHIPELAGFELVMMSNEVHLLKPDPAIFELALEGLAMPAAQVLFIDDLAANVEAAQALGMTGIVHADWAVTPVQIEAWLASL